MSGQRGTKSAWKFWLFVIGACVSVGSIVSGMIVLIFANRHGDYIRYLQISFVIGAIFLLFGLMDSLNSRKHPRQYE